MDTQSNGLNGSIQPDLKLIQTTVVPKIVIHFRIPGMDIKYKHLSTS